MKKKGGKILCVFIILMFFSIFQVSINGKNQTSESDSAKVTLAELDKLMSEKSIKNSQKAIKGYELLLKDDPNNYEILYKLAEAYVTIIDISTRALMVEKDEYKPTLKTFGKIAQDYAKKAYEINPKNKEVVATYLSAYGYYSASFGILKAVLKGAAGHYKDLANQLNELDETYEGGFGYRMLGKLYHVAPWPVGSKKKALNSFKKAVEIDNTSLYTHYYLGLINYSMKKYDIAEKEFKFVRENEPNIYEKHFIKAYKKEANTYLTIISNIKKRKK